MAYSGSTLLSLPVITTGTESGKWGDITNNGLTQYLDISIAGALSITSSATLANTSGSDTATNIGATTAQYRTLVVPASGPSANVVITAPSSNRTYHVVNRNATYTVQIRAGANSGVTFGVNQSGTVTYNSVTGDYELVGPIGPTVPVARGGTGLTSGTSGGILYYSATGTLASSGALAANALVIGGGAGVAPSTTTTGANVLTFLGTPSSANLAAAVTDETGSGSLVFATSPSLTTPLLGTPTSGNLSNCTADGTNSVGFKKVPQSGSAKTTSYTLTTSDVGKFIEVGSGGSITIPDATFAAGDAILVFNNTSGSITITCTITTAYIAGTDADKATVSLATRGIASILFASGTVCTITGNVS